MTTSSDDRITNETASILDYWSTYMSDDQALELSCAPASAIYRFERLMRGGMRIDRAMANVRDSIT